MPTVFITGANRGLGLEFVRQYSDDGWMVFAACRNPDSATNLKELSGDIHICTLDVSDSRQIKALANRLKKETIDVLINNAGIHGPYDKTASFGNVDTEKWVEIIRVNVIAPLKVTEAFLDNVASSKRKTIVFISSRSGSISERGLLPHHEHGGSIIYRSSKTALNSVAKNLAYDLFPRGVGVLVLHPGWVRTDMGGREALIDKKTSVSGMRCIIEEFKLPDSGTFRNYDGEVIPW